MWLCVHYLAVHLYLDTMSTQCCSCGSLLYYNYIPLQGLLEDLFRPNFFLPPRLQRDYPSHMHIDLMRRAQGQGVGTRMLRTLLATLKAQGAVLKKRSNLFSCVCMCYFRRPITRSKVSQYSNQTVHFEALKKLYQMVFSKLNSETGWKW